MKNQFNHNLVSYFVIIFCFMPLHLFAAEGLPDTELQRLNEAMKQIRTHSLHIPKSTRGMTDDLIRSFIRSIDVYGDFLTSREYTAFVESGNSDYFGVEMDIEKKNGHIYLYPFVDGLAEKAGIRPADELIAVNGSPVYSKSVFLVGSTIRGARGETVQLTVKSKKGRPRLFNLRREDINYISVRFHASEQTDYIRITRFVKNTADLLKKILKNQTNANRPLIIDLRGNQGGSIRIARQCADFFIQPGTALFHLQTREGIQDILAESPVIHTGSVILVQDRNTASAAEMFIGAMQGNGRTVSVGENSYGKGVAQRFIPLSDGSALRLTYAEILTPGKKAYNGKGLQPVIPLPREFLHLELTEEQFANQIADVVRTNGK